MTLFMPFFTTTTTNKTSDCGRRWCCYCNCCSGYCCCRYCGRDTCYSWYTTISIMTNWISWRWYCCWCGLCTSSMVGIIIIGVDGFLFPLFFATTRTWVCVVRWLWWLLLSLRWYNWWWIMCCVRLNAWRWVSRRWISLLLCYCLLTTKVYGLWLLSDVLSWTLMVPCNEKNS